MYKSVKSRKEGNDYRSKILFFNVASVTDTGQCQRTDSLRSCCTEVEAFSSMNEERWIAAHVNAFRYSEEQPGFFSATI